jgi:hypothetical protein
LRGIGLPPLSLLLSATATAAAVIASVIIVIIVIIIVVTVIIVVVVFVVLPVVRNMIQTFRVFRYEVCRKHIPASTAFKKKYIGLARRSSTTRWWLRYTSHQKELCSHVAKQARPMRKNWMRMACYYAKAPFRAIESGLCEESNRTNFILASGAATSYA